MNGRCIEVVVDGIVQDHIDYKEDLRIWEIRSTSERATKAHLIRILTDQYHARGKKGVVFRDV